MEQKRPADIFQEALDYLWNGLGLEEKGWKRLKKGDFKKKMKNGLTYQIWFDRSRYNYIDYEIGHGNVEVGFSCIIKQGDDYLYSFRIEPTTGGSFFRMLTEDLRLNTRLLDTFLPLIKAHYLDFIDRFEVDPAEALQPVCAPFKLMKTIIDHYGEAVPTRTYDEEHFTTNIEVDPSGTFYGWVFKFMGGIQIIAPQECVEEMKRIAHRFL